MQIMPETNINDSRGFTLLEMLIVIVIMAIIITTGVFSFGRWQKKYGIEVQMRQIANDLSNARAASFQKKAYQTIVTVSGQQMIYQSYSSDKQTVAAATVKLLKYPVGSKQPQIIIDGRGMVPAAGSTIYADPTTAETAVDCIAVSTGRDNLGKKIGDTCVAQ